MRFWDFNRNVGSARILLEFGRELGLDQTLMLSDTGINTADFTHDDAELSAAQELQLIHNVIQAKPAIKGMGLRCGLRYNLDSFGIWGDALRSSSTLGDAVHLALRFIRLTYAFSLISLYETKTHAILTFGEPQLNADLTRFLVERDMAAAAGMLLELAGQKRAIDHLSFRFKATGEELGVLQGIQDNLRPAFGARLNSISVPRALFHLPLKGADTELVGHFEALCTSLLEKRRSGVRTSQQVRQYLKVPGMNIPDQPTMAQLMSMSERTLKRRLAAEGTSFRDIVGEQRKTLSAELVRKHQISVTEVAARLGFSNLSSFSQAFKRWHGCSPMEFKARSAPTWNGDTCHPLQTKPA